MKARRTYMVPAICVYKLTAREKLLDGSLSTTFVSNPGVGEAGSDEDIGTESRKADNGFWDE